MHTIKSLIIAALVRTKKSIRVKDAFVHVLTYLLRRPSRNASHDEAIHDRHASETAAAVDAAGTFAGRADVFERLAVFSDDACLRVDFDAAHRVMDLGHRLHDIKRLVFKR